MYTYTISKLFHNKKIVLKNQSTERLSQQSIDQNKSSRPAGEDEPSKSSRINYSTVRKACPGSQTPKTLSSSNPKARCQ